MYDLIYIIVTEINGYKNIYGHIVFADEERAKEVAKTVRDADFYDDVFVCSYTLCPKGGFKCGLI